MLCLSRKVGERIIIGDGIELTVLSIDRHHVRLGFTAPPDIPINRQEVMDRIAERRADTVCPVAAAWRDEPMEGGGGGG
mgnify:CR=1 FL=1